MSSGRFLVAALVALLGASCAAPGIQPPGGGGVALPTQMPSVGADEIATEKRRQMVLTLQSFAAQATRVESVSHRLLVANRADCRNLVTAKLGMGAFSRNELDARYRDIVAEALNLDAERITVINVVPGGPAAKAGFATGDALVAFNGTPIPTTRASQWLAAQVHRNGREPARFETLRQGRPHTRVVQPEVGCAIPVLTAPTLSANASTDGRRIVIHTGVLRVAPTDAELAAVIGHELAHITMGHNAKRAQVRAAGAVGSIIFGDGVENLGDPPHIAMLRAFSIETEREADYVGTYYAARAGYDVSAGERVWRALALENPRQINFAGMHPTTPERVILLQKTAQEIAEKKRRNLPLDPEIRARQAAAQSPTVGTDQ